MLEKFLLCWKERVYASTTSVDPDYPVHTQNKKPLKRARSDCRQFDLENRQTKVNVKVTMEINRTCHWLPSGKVCNPFQC